MFNVDGCSWVIDEPIRDILGRAVLVTEDDVFLGDTRCGGSRVRIAHVADDEVAWHGSRIRVCSVAPKGIRRLEVTGRVLLQTIYYTPCAGNPDLIEEQGDWEGELVSPVLAPLYSSDDRRFLLDSFACNYEDHPVTRRDESDIPPVELAALHHELLCVGFLTSRRKGADPGMVPLERTTK